MIKSKTKLPSEEKRKEREVNDQRFECCEFVVSRWRQWIMQLSREQEIVSSISPGTLIFFPLDSFSLYKTKQLLRKIMYYRAFEIGLR